MSRFGSCKWPFRRWKAYHGPDHDWAVALFRRSANMLEDERVRHF